MDKEFIYIFDEDDGLNNENVINFINNPEYTIIMITRDLTFPEINYSLDDIYEFKESNKYNILNKKYNNLNKISTNKEKLDKILTEDSRSGFEFYKNLKNFKVTTSNGNSNILKNIKDNQIIVFDSLGIGPHIKYILWKTSVLNCYMIYPKSFEWLLLESGIFGKTRYEVEKYKNEGEYYYKLLRRVSNLYRKPYSKDRLNKWILENNQYDKVILKIDELFKINLKELNKRLENNNNNLKWGDL